MDVASSVLLYAIFCAILFLAYFVVKFVVMRREAREKFEKERKLS